MNSFSLFDAFLGYPPRYGAATDIKYILDNHLPASYAATTANLTASYFNGLNNDGVGATLTNTGTLAAFSVDGTNPPINSLILVKDQSSQIQNGYYNLTTVGSGSISWVLTRATFFNIGSLINAGDISTVLNGTANANTGWLVSSFVTTIGTDPITFSTNLIVSVAEAMLQARIDVSDTDELNYMRTLILAVTTFCENFTRRDLLYKTYTAYMSMFPSNSTSFASGIQLRRGILQNVKSINYLVNGVSTVFPASNYYTSKSNDYSSVYVNNNTSWPDNVDDRVQSINIVFTSGYGPDGTYLPYPLRMAILQHITFMYQARGDGCDGSCGQNFPAQARYQYEQYKIESFGGLG